jgi:hypothetical protein
MQDKYYQKTDRSGFNHGIFGKLIGGTLAMEVTA